MREEVVVFRKELVSVTDDVVVILLEEVVVSVEDKLFRIDTAGVVVGELEGQAVSESVFVKIVVVGEVERVSTEEGELVRLVEPVEVVVAVDRNAFVLVVVILWESE